MTRVTLGVSKMGIGRAGLICFSVGVLMALIWRSDGLYLSQFPGSYTWTDMMINYEGGFSRRALLGELALRLNHYIPAPYFLTILVTGAYIAVTIWLSALASQIRLSIAFLFLFSPVTLLFPIYDSDAFGRKDIFVLLAFCAAITTIRIRSARLSLFLILVVYFIAGLITETSWFYLPLAIAAFAIIRGAEKPFKWHLLLWFTVALFLVANFAVTYLSNQAVDKTAIVESWKAIYPDAFVNLGAVTYLGAPLALSWGMVILHQRDPTTLVGYLIGFSLANIPLLLLLTVRRLRKANIVATSSIFFGITAALMTFAVGADWGRYIYLFTCQLFVFFVIVSVPVILQPQKGRSAIWQSVIGCCLAMLYLSTWQLKHFRPHGSNPLFPGKVFGIPEDKNWGATWHR
jgi:hypothetical protein